MKKKIFCLFLVLVLVASTFATVSASNRDRDLIGEEAVVLYSRADALRLAVMDFTHEAVVHSAQNLSLQKQAVMHMYEEFGFTFSQVANMQLGTPFSIYVFDDSRIQIDMDVLVFPIVYNGNIIGVLETMYDESLGERFFTFGRSYADELNALQQGRYANMDFIVVNYGDILFASNGENVVVICDRRLEDSEDQLRRDVSESEMNYLAFSVASRAQLEFADVAQLAAVSFSNEMLYTSFISESSVAMRASNFRLLPVRHVPQTGGCGVAAWAAVLNFRFQHANYTGDSLARAMFMEGFIHNINTLPNMAQFRDYANHFHLANTVLAFSPLNITQVRSTIDSWRPIMGNWTQPRGSSSHAINIIGYEAVQGASFTFYFVLNPWHTTPHPQSVIVNHSNPTHVVHLDGGVYWVFDQSVR